jgi:hypothetical protein
MADETEEARRLADENEVRGKLQALGRQIKGELPEGFGFVLLCSAYGGADENRALLYTATMQRVDAIQLMREFIAVQKEERNWEREMPELEIREEFDTWWANQAKRDGGKLPLKWDTAKVKEWCRDAFEGGRSTA